MESIVSYQGLDRPSSFIGTGAVHTLLPLYVYTPHVRWWHSSFQGILHLFIGFNTWISFFFFLNEINCNVTISESKSHKLAAVYY